MRTAFVKSIIAAAAVLAAGSAAAIGNVSGQGTWETTLKARDINHDGKVDAYYDTDLNISWLANANLLAVPWVSTGRTDYYSAVQAVDSLVVGGAKDWHLPTINIDNCGGDNENEFSVFGQCGYGVDPSTSQMAHMFSVTLGNTSAPHVGDTLSNIGPFADLQSFGYWFSRDYTTWQGNKQDWEAWRFSFAAGRQDIMRKDSQLHVWAVHDGDVGLLAPVPEPETYSMMLAGLGAMVLVARRRRNS